MEKARPGSHQMGLYMGASCRPWGRNIFYISEKYFQFNIHLGVSWNVDDEDCQNCFEYESKVEDVIVERFLHHGVLPGPGLYGGHPLDHDHTEEKAGLAGELQQLPVLVRPLLVVAVRQVVDGQGVPLVSDPWRKKKYFRNI